MHKQEIVHLLKPGRRMDHGALCPYECTLKDDNLKALSDAEPVFFTDLPKVDW